MSLLKNLFYTLLGTASILYLVVKVSLDYWKSRGILHKKPYKPWGHLRGAGSKYHLADILRQHYDTYKDQAPFVGFYIWLKPTILILNMDIVNDVLERDAQHFTKRRFFNNALSERNDTELHPHLSNVLPVLNQIFKTFELSLKDKIKQEMTLNINELINGLNTDVMSNLAFGFTGDTLRYGETQFDSITKRFVNNVNNLYKNCLTFNYPALANFLQTLDIIKPRHKLILNKLHERNYALKESQNDFTQIWSNASIIEQQQQQHEAEICNEALCFIMSSLEVFNTTFICCLYELAKQQDVQDKARHEIKKVLKHNNYQLTMEALEDLVYLKQILWETLRKHTPYPFLLRTTEIDYEISKTVFMFKRGNHLIIPATAIHHDPKYYTNPNKFDPDHFHTSQKDMRPKNAFLPFGLGCDSYILRKFASLYMLIGLVNLLNGFQYRPGKETPETIEYDNSFLILKVKNDLQLLVKQVSSE